MKRLLLILSFVLALSDFAVDAQNLVANPSFETWTSGTQPITNWVITTPANGTVAQDTAHNDGAKSCKMFASGTYHEIYQYATVTPGKTYTLSVSYYIYGGVATNAGIWCNFKTAANGSNIALSLTDSLLLKGPGGATKFFASVLNSWQTYTCNVVAPAGSTVFRFGIRTYKASTVSWDKCSFTENLTPVINKSVSTLSGFSYAPGAGPSVQQSFTISGSNLTSSMTVTAPANYELSTNSGAAFTALANPFTITPSGGVVSPVTLYARLKAGLTANTYTGNINLTSGSLAQAIALSGTVAAPPVTLTTSTTSLSGFTYVEGSGPSTQQSFTLSGSNLTSGIVVTPPTSNYEISISSGTAFSPLTTPFTISRSGGSVAPVTIYVRLKSGVVAGNYTGSITLSTTGATKTIALSGTITVPAGISLSPTSLTGFSYGVGGGPSTIKSFNISGIGLTSSVVITPPADFEISDTASPFTATGLILLVPSNGNVASTPIYVRLKSGLPVSTYNESISLSSTGFTTKTVSLSGNVLLTTGAPETSANNLSVYTSGGNIFIRGTAKDEIVSLYSITGMRLQTIKSQGEQIEITAQPGAVYLVKTTTKIFKVIL
ncbi:MAG TPA: hypothetical protein VI413_09270 [Paludibacter sp.]